MSNEADLVEVSCLFSAVGHEGPGFYVYETEYPEEGYVHFSPTQPTLEDVKAVCPEYTFDAVQ